jgi:hypothetical protein
MTLPPETPVHGPAHGRAARLLATAAVLLVLIGLARLVLTTPEALGAPLLLAVLVLLAPYGLLMLSTTTIDAEGIRQTGLPERKLRWDQLAQATVGGSPFARRLRVRTVAGRRIFFAGGTPELEAAFARIAAAYPVR